MNAKNNNFEPRSLEFEPPLDSAPPSVERIQSNPSVGKGPSGAFIERIKQVWTGKNAVSEFERAYPKLPQGASAAETAQYMVEKRSHFVPSRDFPAPSRIFGATELEDLAAVIAGSKPAAFLKIDSGREIDKVLIRMAQEKGLEVKIQSSTAAAKSSPMKQVLVGSKDQVGVISKLLEEYDGKLHDYEFARRLGKLLGYPDDAIEEFIERSKSYERHKKL